MFVSIITSDMKMDIIIAMKWCQNYHKVLLERFWEKPRIRLRQWSSRKISWNKCYTIDLTYKISIYIDYNISIFIEWHIIPFCNLILSNSFKIWYGLSSCYDRCVWLYIIKANTCLQNLGLEGLKSKQVGKMSGWWSMILRCRSCFI